MPKFQILRMDHPGTPRIMDGPGPLLFDDPAAASAHAKILARVYGEKLCVKPVHDEGWRKRENDRFLSGEYRPLPWHDKAWWQDAYPIWKDHFPHAALEKPGWVAYTKSEDDGAKNKKSLLRPGAYLNKYFERHLEVHGVIERKCVEQFMTMYGPIDVYFAETEADIIKVYERGPQTCIAGKDWPNGIHPASIYAAGDLAIAYMGAIDGRISARALVWPKMKLHSRIYGDIARLTQGLTRLGYVWGPPIGAKLKRIQLRPVDVKNGRVPSGCFIAPYIDKKNQQGGGHLAVEDKGDHLMICLDGGPGTHHCGGADGLSGGYVLRQDEHPKFVCDRCGAENARDVTAVYIESVNDDGENGDHEHWCRNCLLQHSWNCRYSGNYYSSDVEFTDVGGLKWLPFYADMYASRCEGNGKLYPTNELRRVFMPDGGHKMFCNEWIKRRLGGIFTSQLTNRMYPNSENVAVYTDGAYVINAARQELKHHTFQCDACDNHWQLHFRAQMKGGDHLLCPKCLRTFRETKKFVLSERANTERNQQKLPLIAAE